MKPPLTPQELTDLERLCGEATEGRTLAPGKMAGIQNEQRAYNRMLGDLTRTHTGEGIG